MEKILAVPADVLKSFVPLGLTKLDETSLLSFAQSEGQFYDRTPQLEENAALKQIIVYFTVQHGDKWLMYQRANKSLDKRTHGKFSIAFGGHVNSIDSVNGQNPVLQGLQRELTEELELPQPAHFQFLGALNIDKAPIDKYHMGFVYQAQLPSASYQINEPESFAWSGWSSPQEIAAKYDLLESWSKEVFGALFPTLVPQKI